MASFQKDYSFRKFEYVDCSTLCVFSDIRPRIGLSLEGFEQLHGWRFALKIFQNMKLNNRCGFRIRACLALLD